MINYIEKFYWLFGIKRSLLKRLLFMFPFPLSASVRNLFSVESWTCSREGMFVAPAVPNNYIGLAQLFPEWKRLLLLAQPFHAEETVVT